MFVPHRQFINFQVRQKKNLFIRMLSQNCFIADR